MSNIRRKDVKFSENRKLGHLHRTKKTPKETGFSIRAWQVVCPLKVVQKLTSRVLYITVVKEDLKYIVKSRAEI